ncbi:hypothetical protein [Streptomyces sp. NPDC048650]|uniref:hypothetical protein n=1 Tax=Streptomyces sp. NPDC048650 TaxID=3365583 RepID=UPI0037135D05
MYDIDMLRFQGSNKHAGPRLVASDVEAWLRRHIIDVYPDTMEAVDYASYRPPSPEHVLKAFQVGCQQEERIRVDLCKVVKLVNKCCGTAIDPSETAWQRVGLEEQRKVLRQDEMHKLHTALGAALVQKERKEREARLITLGPYRVDPELAAHCPACLQHLPTGLLLKQQTTVQLGTVVKPRQPAAQLPGESVAGGTSGMEQGDGSL